MLRPASAPPATGIKSLQERGKPSILERSNEEVGLFIPPLWERQPNPNLGPGCRSCAGPYANEGSGHRAACGRLEARLHTNILSAARSAHRATCGDDHLHLNNGVWYARARHAMSIDENRADFARVPWGGVHNKGPERPDDQPQGRGR